ncbi:MAG: hypothetical protein ACRDK9_08335 [Solirubrobacterales bacterium]
MRRKLALTAGTAVAVAVAGAGAVVAGGIGDGPGQGSGPVEIRTAEARPVAAPSTVAAPARAVSPRRPKRKRPEVTYLETEPQTLPAGKTGFVIGDCAGRAKAISGYYFVQGQFNGFGLENEGDSPAGQRRWAFYLDAEQPSTGVSDVIFGMVCIKGVR